MLQRETMFYYRKPSFFTFHINKNCRCLKERSPRRTFLLSTHTQKKRERVRDAPSVAQWMTWDRKAVCFFEQRYFILWLVLV